MQEASVHRYHGLSFGVEVIAPQEVALLPSVSRGFVILLTDVGGISGDTAFE